MAATGNITERSHKRSRKMQSFWKKLTTDNLSSLHEWFQNGGSKYSDGKQLGRGISGGRIRNQDSLDATGSLISSTGFAHGDVLSEEGIVEGVAGTGLETINTKGGKGSQVKRPKNSMNQEEWVEALTRICGGSKIAEDATI